jgi:hypothetical protein
VFDSSTIPETEVTMTNWEELEKDLGRFEASLN